MEGHLPWEQSGGRGADRQESSLPACGYSCPNLCMPGKHILSAIRPSRQASGGCGGGRCVTSLILCADTEAVGLPLRDVLNLEWRLEQNSIRHPASALPVVLLCSLHGYRNLRLSCMGRCLPRKKLHSEIERGSEFSDGSSHLGASRARGEGELRLVLPHRAPVAARGIPQHREGGAAEPRHLPAITRRRCLP